MKTIRLSAVLQTLGLCAGVLAADSALAQTASTNYTVGAVIPDNNSSGIAVQEQFSAPGLISISSLTITLDISGGVNGDYYAYLQHGPGFTVLLNRVGKDGSTPTGYTDSGLNITLDDSAVNGDIHTYQLTLNPGGGALTGTWAPDGRTDDPSTVTTASPRTTDLGSFSGLDPNGTWTLFVADVNPGGVGTLESFGLNVTGVPEPAAGWLIFAGLGVLFLTRRIAARFSGAPGK